jgi:nucleoid DNA-binding protein
MTKAELVSKLVEDSKVTKKSFNAMFNSLVAAIQESLKKEGKVRLDG